MYYQRHLAYQGFGWGGEEWGLKFREVVHVYTFKRSGSLLLARGDLHRGFVNIFSRRVTGFTSG